MQSLFGFLLTAQFLQYLRSGMIKVQVGFTTPIYYWSDLDAQGFLILSRLHSLFPHITSVMLNVEQGDILRLCRPLYRKHSLPHQQLPYLTLEEHNLFAHPAKHNLRLERERISYSYVVRQLEAA